MSYYPLHSNGIAQKYISIDPGRQRYINPSHIQSNLNYYQSPIINSPPFNQQQRLNPHYYDPYAYQYYNSQCPANYNYNWPYQNQNYYQGFYAQSPIGYGCQNQNYGYSYNQNCYGTALPSYGYGCNNQYSSSCGCGCQGNGNCYEYGLKINKSRLTPHPSKLPHSYITSGSQVQNKLVINQPTHESAPFQSQRRKTYVPYTRKYIEYQDYMQYIPLQKSQWAYKKVMKQIDFVPQQYYESSIQVLPRQKIVNKIRYIPIQQQIVHIPQQMVIKNQHHIHQKTNNHIQAQVEISHSKGHRNPTLIHPAVSTFQMVPNSKLQPRIYQRISQTSHFGHKHYQHLQKSQNRFESQNMNPAFNSFGPGGTIISSSNLNQQIKIRQSEVMHSGYSHNNAFDNNLKDTIINEHNRKIQILNHKDHQNLDQVSELKRPHSIIKKFQQETY